MAHIRRSRQPANSTILLCCPLLTLAHPCAPLLTIAHPCSPLLTIAHHCSQCPTGRACLLIGRPSEQRAVVPSSMLDVKSGGFHNTLSATLCQTHLTMLKCMYHYCSPIPMPPPHCQPPPWLVMLQCLSDGRSSPSSVKPCLSISSMVAIHSDVLTTCNQASNSNSLHDA